VCGFVLENGRFCVMLLSYFDRTFVGINVYRGCNHLLHLACTMVSLCQWLVYVVGLGVCGGVRPPRT
jgi:hypothetical protein